MLPSSAVCFWFPGVMCAGLVIQGWSWLLEKFSRAAAVDMTSFWVKLCRGSYYAINKVLEVVWPTAWGFFHVGQVLLLECCWAEPPAGWPEKPGKQFIEVNKAKKHNLEVRLR